MANTRELAQFASFVDFTGTSIGFSTQFNVSGVSTFTNTVIFDSTGSIQIPKGTTGQRLSGVLGQIRYNTSLSQFEGYGAGNAWGSLGGVKDVDGDTFIRAESAAGEDEDVLEFLTGNSTRLVIDSTGKVGIGSTIPTVTLDVVGNAKISGVLTATTFSGSIATSDLSGNVTDSQLTEDYIKTSEVDDSSIEFSGGSLNVKASGITNAMLAGSITNDKLAGSITNDKLAGSITNDKLAGSITNDKLAGSIANDKLAGSIANDKLANSSVSFGGVSVALGAADATPAFDLQDATGYPFTSLTGITTDIFGDTTPTLGGNLDANSKDITGVNNLNVSSASTFSGPISVGDTISLGNNDRLKFGDNEVFEIYSTGTNSVIRESGSGNLKLLGTNIIFKNGGDTEVYADFNNNGSVDLYYDNSKKFETTGIGVSILSGAGLTATIAGPPNLVIDPGTVGDNTGNVRIKGDLFVDGTTTQINSTALEIADFIVGIATTATSDALADGAGIQIGPSGNTFLYDNTNEAFTSTENLNVASGHTYKIAGTDVLSATTLGSNVVNSSLTSVGSLAQNLNITSGNTYKINGTDVLSATTLGSAVVNSSLTSVGTLTGLTVSSDVSIADKIVHTGDTNTAIRFPGADIFTAETGGSERLRCDSDGVKTLNGRFYSAGTFAFIESSSTSNSTLTLKKTASGADAIDYLQLRDNSNALKLKIDGDGIIFTPDVLASHEGDTNTKIRFPANDTFSVETAGDERLRINSSGNVGIGTDAPDAKLEVRDASSTGIIVRSNNTQTTDVNKALRVRNNSDTNTFHVSHKGQGYFAGSVGIGTDNPASVLHIHSGAPRITMSDSGTGSHHRINADSSVGNFAFDVDYDSATSTPSFIVNIKGGEKLRITSDGKVGIGTDNPQRKFVVSDGGTEGLEFFVGDAVNGSTINAYNRATAAFTPFSLNAQDYRFSPNGGTEAVRITSTGKVGIGSISPAQLLDIASTAPNIRFTDTVDGHSEIDGNAAELKFNADKGNTKADSKITFFVDNDEKLRIDSDGDVGINTTTPVNRLFVEEPTGTHATRTLVTFRKNHTTTTVSGNIAKDSFPHALMLENSDNSSDTGLASLGFTKFTSGAQSQAAIVGESTSAGTMDLTFHTESSNTIAEKVRITSDGKIGIGTDNPSDKLSIFADPNSLVIGAKDTTRGNHIFQLLADDVRGNGELRLYRHSASGTHEKVVEITSLGNSYLKYGNLGIGTDNPTQKLEINNITAGASLLIRTSPSTSGGNLLFGDDASDTSGRVGYVHSSDYMYFSTAGDERLRIDSDGRLLKSGQAALTSTSLSHSVQVAASSEANAIAIIGRAADDIGELSFYEADKSTKLGELQYRQDHLNFRHRVGYISFATGGTTERIQIQSNGQILFKGTSGDNQFTSRRTNVASSNGDYFFHLNAQNNSSTTVGSLGFHRDTATDDSRFVISTKNTGGSLTERLRITSAGDLQRPKSLSQEVSTSVSSVSATSCGSFAKATYRSAYVIAQITQGSSYQVGRYLVIHDGTTATTIEESAIATGDMLGTFSGVVSGSNVEFRVTMSSASSATVITKIESIVV